MIKPITAEITGYTITLTIEEVEAFNAWWEQPIWEENYNDYSASIAQIRNSMPTWFKELAREEMRRRHG